MEINEKEYDKYDTTGIGKYRRWFSAAVDAAQKWRAAAKEDYSFVAGKQWTDSEVAAFKESGRPAITINRIKPLINVLSGYQRLNRYDIQFLPRTPDDQKLCEVRKGMTKYVLDRSFFDKEESRAFLDAVIGGIGWFEVGYRFNDEVGDGEAIVKREDPFGIYLDPEAHAEDFSDAKYIFRAKWVDKDDLKQTYPEHADDIDLQCEVYDKLEEEGRQQVKETDPLWYERELKKVRLVECWYKVKEKETIYYLTDGTQVPQAEMKVEYLLNGLIAGTREVSVTRVKVCTFFDRVLLEDMPSPYEHNELPFVPIVCYYYGAGDIPAGFVRDLKDPQREFNKRRIQQLHILNTSGNGGGWIEDDAMTPEQEADFKKHGSVPGHFQKVKTGTLAQGKIKEREVGTIPSGLITAEQQNAADLITVSGINEALMGTDIPAQSSGRAIELKQKQAITHIAPMFDALRYAKKKIALLLWGERGHKGIIPQYYTEDKVYRVEGVNGQQFVRVNEQVMMQDPTAGVIHQTLNDLSQGEFDIVVSDVTASATQRQAQMWELLDSVQTLGLPGDMVFDIILDLSDLPNKDEIKRRWQERQQQAAQQAQQRAQAQQQLEIIKNQNNNMSIAYKDAPLPIQLAMAAKQGLIDSKIAEYAVQVMVQNLFPQMAAESQQQEQAQAVQQAQAIMAQQPPQSSVYNMSQPQQGGSVMTDAAAKSVMSGMTPGAL